MNRYPTAFLSLSMPSQRCSVLNARALRINGSWTLFINKIGEFGAIQSWEELANTLTSMIVKRLISKPEAGNDREGMSLPDKMRMWGRKSPREDSEAKSLESDPFWRVDDACFDPIESTGSSTHINMVLDSEAYKWLLASLKKALSLQWGLPSVMICLIRREVLDMLPKQGSPASEVIFKLPWQPLRDRLIQARVHQAPDGSDPAWETAYGPTAISGIFALTRSSRDEIQVTTVREYFEQTWLDSGGQLLNWLDEVFAERDSHNFLIGKSTKPTPMFGPILKILQSIPSIESALSSLVGYCTSASKFQALHSS